MKFISIIIPCYNEEKYIHSCIESILSQDYPFNRLEVFFVDGISTDSTRNTIQTYCRKYPFIKLLDNQRKIVPCAMNIGIYESIGDYIIRLDAHSIYPSNYFSKLIKYAQNLNSDNIGVTCFTDVKIKTQKSMAIMEILSHRLGVGNSPFRTGTTRVMEVDTVPFGCFRKDVFNRFGFFDERLFRNQDIELNKRIKRGGGKIFIVPDIQCTYFARETFGGLIKNNFQNGLWNILTVYYTRTISSLSLRHFIPFFFILTLIVPLLLSIGHFSLILICISSFLFYTINIFIVSILLSKEKKLSVHYLILSFFLLHFSYGIGSLVGLVRLPFLKH